MTELLQAQNLTFDSGLEVYFIVGAIFVIGLAGWLIGRLAAGSDRPYRSDLNLPHRVIFAGISGGAENNVYRHISKYLRLECAPLRRSINLRLKLLRRRFPIEKDYWNRLIEALPESSEELLGGKAADLIVWGEIRSEDSTLTIRTNSARTEYGQQDANGFALQNFQGLPIDADRKYSPFIAAFIVGRIWPAIQMQNVSSLETLDRLNRKFSLRLDELLRIANKDLAFDLMYLDGWIRLQLGCETENLSLLETAENIFENLLNQWPGDRTRLEYAQLWTNISSVRFHIASISEDIEKLETALDASDAALAVHSREHDPWRWAALQKLRSSIFRTIGAGLHDDDRMEEAISSIRSAMIVWTRSAAPTRWAQSRKELADILVARGEGSAGTDHLMQAIEIYKSVLNPDLDDLPVQLLLECRRALGNCLLMMAERKGSVAPANDAKNLLRPALVLAQKWKFSEQAITIRILLGRAFVFAGQQGENKSLLVQAVETLRIPPQELRQCSTGEWAEARHTLAKALAILGAGSMCTEKLEEAETILTPLVRPLYSEHLGRRQAEIAEDLADICMQLDLRLPDRKRTDLAEKYLRIALEGHYGDVVQYAKNQRHAMLFRKLAKLQLVSAKQHNENSRQSLDSAISSFRQALKALRRDEFPLLWARVQTELGAALSSISAMGGGTPRLEQAAEAYGKALEHFTLDKTPHDRARTLNELGIVLADLGSREKSKGRFKSAAQAFAEAFDIYSANSCNDLARLAQSNLERAEMAMHP